MYIHKLIHQEGGAHINRAQKTGKAEKAGFLHHNSNSPPLTSSPTNQQKGLNIVNIVLYGINTVLK